MKVYCNDIVCDCLWNVLVLDRCYNIMMASHYELRHDIMLILKSCVLGMYLKPSFFNDTQILAILARPLANAKFNAR